MSCQTVITSLISLFYCMHINSYESINQDKRLIIEELNTNITEEEKKQQEQL